MDLFRTAGKFWIANIVATVGFAVGLATWPALLGVLGGLFPMIEGITASLVPLSFYVALATGSIGWAWVMLK